LYILYNQVLAGGFSAELKRRAFYQPVSIAATCELLRQHPSFTRSLTDSAIEHAIERLEAWEHQAELLPSEQGDVTTSPLSQLPCLPYGFASHAIRCW